jgi:hypothetical protein
MRGKRSEIPVEVVVHKRRGRPPKGFMPPIASPAPAESSSDDENEGEEGRAPLVSDEEWREADPVAALPNGEAERATEPANHFEDGDGLGATDGDERDPIETGSISNPETLAGDMRDLILNQIQRQEKVWGKMLNYEQAVLADQIYKICKLSVAEALRIILNVPFAHVDVTIDKIAVDKDVKIALSTPLTGGALSKIGEALHNPACLILASASEFQGQKKAPNLDPDQPALKLEHNAGVESELA